MIRLSDPCGVCGKAMYMGRAHYCATPDGMVYASFPAMPVPPRPSVREALAYLSAFTRKRAELALVRPTDPRMLALALEDILAKADAAERLLAGAR